MFGGVISIAWLILTLLAGFEMFNKMGIGGWKSFIPIYRDFVLYKAVWSGDKFLLYAIFSLAGDLLVEFSGGSFLMLFIGWMLTIISLVYNFRMCLKLSEGFGHGIDFGLGLFFLFPIFEMILGFSSDKFDPNRIDG